MASDTVRLTMAQALVRYLCTQFTEIDGRRVPLFAGVFAIFGHGNVTCLSEALEAVQDKLPTWRGQNEQSMALAAIGFAKAKRRRQIMVAASSIGPGAANMVTAAGVAHANRLPVLLLSGDTFASRLPDPVLQQVEHFGDPTITTNDAFKAVTRYWDRITLPEQILSSLPQAVATMLDPADCGPAFIALAQDTQEKAFDYPLAFFEPTVWSIPRPRPDRRKLEEAVALLKTAKKPLLIAGGGVRYSIAEQGIADFAVKRGLPIVETIAGKGSVTHDHPAHAGPLGIVGSTSANTLAEEADVILAIGTRLQDFATGSWTAFRKDARFIAINAARFDAVKHRSLAVVGDALETVRELDAALGDWRAAPALTKHAKALFADWNRLLDDAQTPTNTPVPTYAQVIAAVNRHAKANDTLVTAAGGLPGEVSKGWRVKDPNTFDCEFGSSCMGYEIPGGWGRHGQGRRRRFDRHGRRRHVYDDELGRLLIGPVGTQDDHRRLRQWRIRRHQPSSKRQGRPRLQQSHQGLSGEEALPVDFVKHAEAMGALACRVESIGDLEAAMDWAQSTDRTTIITLVTDAFAWVPGDADWDVGVPEVSERGSVREARAAQEEIRKKQRVEVLKTC